MKCFNIIDLLLFVSIVSAHNDYNGGKDPYKQEKPCDGKTITKTVCITKTVSACPNPILTDPSKNLKTLPYERPKYMIYRKRENKPSKNGIGDEDDKQQQTQNLPKKKNSKHKPEHPPKEDPTSPPAHREPILKPTIVYERQHNNRKDKSNRGLKHKPINRRPRKQHNEEE